MKSRLLLVTLLVVSVLAACGKGESKPASSGDPTTSTTEAAEDTTDTTEAADDTGGDTGGDAGDDATGGAAVSVTGTEYAYAPDDGTDPAALPAGDLTITLVNDGEEEHQLTIMKFREGFGMEDLGALGEDPKRLGEMLETFGGPNAVAPGASGAATSTLAAGDYLFACFIPDANGVPHAASGMVLPVTVVGEGGAESTFEGDGDPLPMGEFTFGLGDADAPAEIAASEDVWFTNDGSQPHEAAIYTVAEGSTNQDVVDFFSSPDTERAGGPPPIVPAGGVGAIDPGRFARAALAHGDYVFICFLPDAADGAPHVVKGMLEFATVS